MEGTAAGVTSSTLSGLQPSRRATSSRAPRRSSSSRSRLRPRCGAQNLRSLGLSLFFFLCATPMMMTQFGMLPPTPSSASSSPPRSCGILAVQPTDTYLGRGALIMFSIVGFGCGPSSACRRPSQSSAVPSARTRRSRPRARDFVAARRPRRLLARPIPTASARIVPVLGAPAADVPHPRRARLARPPQDGVVLHGPVENDHLRRLPPPLLDDEVHDDDDGAPRNSRRNSLGAQLVL